MKKTVYSLLQKEQGGERVGETPEISDWSLGDHGSPTLISKLITEAAMPVGEP